MSVFGKNVKKIRMLHNLSQQEFGELFNVSRGSVGSYEEGRAEPKIDTAIKIAKHFNVSLDVLLTKTYKENALPFEEEISISFEESKQADLPKKFLEERVADLEEKLLKIEQKINIDNDN